MSHHLLYIGPLRPETLPLLEPFHSAEQALFVTPTANSEQWEEVRAIFPQATQQVNKVAEANGEHPYYEFNLPEFNASQPASGLYTLYPGLELIESSPQPLVGVEALLNEQQAHPPSVLVIEQPELVWPLLQALAALPSYQQLRQLWLRVGAMPLYQGMPTVEEILKWCEEIGFEVFENTYSDPDFPLIKLHRNPCFVELKKSFLRIEELEKELDKAQKEVISLKSFLDVQKKNELDLEEKNNMLELGSKSVKKENDELKRIVKNKDEAIVQLEKKLDSNQESVELINEISNKIDQGFSDQKRYIANASSALGKHLTKLIKA
ncbi:hypothetical protein [Halomonas sp. C22]|uniref:hypothetical protein n=1 Tax=Halomonas sp. C22 TaxID=2580567 RepID=UPI0011A5271A|nr:hypothetical protein [Halomonas sp. C22]